MSGIARLVALVALSSSVMSCGVRDTVPVLVSTGCAVDDVTSASRGMAWATKAGEPLEIRGWAADVDRKRLLDEVAVHLVDASGAVAASAWRETFEKRKDVADHFGVPAFEVAGFRVRLETSHLARGVYELFVEQRSPTVRLACRPNRHVTIQ